MASQTKRQKSSEAYRLMYGTCPDGECQAKLFFPSYDKSIECTRCGQRHERSMLKDVAEVTNPDVALHNLLKNVLLGNAKPKKGADDVKVLGLSNYVCKLISPILTYYGRDAKTGKAKLLKEMGKGDVFDVSILGDRAFLLEEDNLNVIGYGQDRSGSVGYLADTLMDIASFNSNESKLVPIHADGDGHCLVHAISRALVGRELFWHALRTNLKNHMEQNLLKYQQLFKDFVDKDEWGAIIEECDPYYIPPDGEAHGLRNIHIFGLANVLCRPIILLDSKSGLSSSGDYSGVFLPGMVPPEQCKGKDGTLNKPLCIAWSSPGRNHYIPIVAIKGKGEAKLPSYMVQKSWGMPKEEIKKYIEFDSLYRCTVGGDKCLTERYLKQLVTTMEEVFVEKYNVNASLVADVHQYIYKSSGIVGVHPDEVTDRTKRTVEEHRLYRCLMCDALVEYTLDRDMFEKGGTLYKLALKIHKKLDPSKLYSFSLQGAVCSYDESRDCLVPDMKRSRPATCAFCSGEMLRQVRMDSSIVYFDGDRTTTPCTGGKCPCGFKHYWAGKEYDNLPEILPITLTWAGKTVTEKVPWFQDETDVTLNSNVFEVAQNLVQKHFPGEFGSERLVQQVVDSILAQSAALLKRDQASTSGGEGSAAGREGETEDQRMGDGMDPWSADTASKIILTGHKKKTMHKEELMKSEKEKQVRKNIQTHAPRTQQKKTTEIEAHKLHMAKEKEKSAVSVTSHPGPSTVTSLPVSQSGPGTGVAVVTQSGAGDKKVRLQTSDGRQVMLALVQDVTYTELQKLIFEAVQVPADRQKIRVGFPPKLLEAPISGDEEPIVQLRHGDKIALEILPDMSLPPPSSLHQSYPPPTVAGSSGKGAKAASAGGMSASWNSFEEDAHSQTAEKLLTALKDAQHGGDSIDTSITSLEILSAVSGKDFWTYVQGMPHLFSVGGLLYNQMKRDLGLIDGKHCQLPCLPGKVFRYNGTDDRLELCLEPYGHFRVEPGIEHKVQQQGLKDTREPEVKFGASGAIHHGHDRQAFLGQGHSMKPVHATDIRMPGDLACAGHRPQARGIHDLCREPGRRSESISEETEEEMQVEQPEESEGDGGYQKLGPGYSVISPAVNNKDNTNLEMFRALADHIEKTLTNTMEQVLEEDEDEISDTGEVTAVTTTNQTASSGTVAMATASDVTSGDANSSATSPHTSGSIEVQTAASTSLPSSSCKENVEQQDGVSTEKTSAVAVTCSSMTGVGDMKTCVAVSDKMAVDSGLATLGPAENVNCLEKTLENKDMPEANSVDTVSQCTDRPDQQNSIETNVNKATSVVTMDNGVNRDEEDRATKNDEMDCVETVTESSKLSPVDMENVDDDNTPADDKTSNTGTQCQEVNISKDKEGDGNKEVVAMEDAEATAEADGEMMNVDTGIPGTLTMVTKADDGDECDVQSVVGNMVTAVAADASMDQGAGLSGCEGRGVGGATDSTAMEVENEGNN